MSRYYTDTTFLGEPKPANLDNHAHAIEEDGDVFENCTFDANGASEALKSSLHSGWRVSGGGLLTFDTALDLHHKLARLSDMVVHLLVDIYQAARQSSRDNCATHAARTAHQKGYWLTGHR